jgi:predicted GIY-YIG superfamily endonuclease
MWYVYAILCDDGSIYKGLTDNIERRYKEHSAGIGSTYTKRHKPIKLIYNKEFATLDAAVEYEKYLKSGSGRKMLNKIGNPPDDWRAGGKAKTTTKTKTKRQQPSQGKQKKIS